MPPLTPEQSAYDHWVTTGRLDMDSVEDDDFDPQHPDEELIAILQRPIRYVWMDESTRLTNPGVGVSMVSSPVEEPLAPWERELLGMPEPGAESRTTTSQVGNPNNSNQEGETMPNEVLNVRIPMNRTLRRTVFDRLGMADALLVDLDPELWQQQMDRLREYESNGAAWPVTVGSFALSGRPRMEYPDGTSSNVDWVPLATAMEIVTAASAGRLSIYDYIDDQNPEGIAGLRRLMPVNGVERAGWRAYFGTGMTGSLEVSTVEGDTLVYVSGLRGTMEQYREFRSHSRYRQYIRDGLRARMGELPDLRSKPKEWTKERTDGFNKFFAGIRENMTIVADPFSDLPMLPKGTLSSRPWGIEIEAVHIDGIQTPEFWSLKGDGSLRGLEVSSLPPSGMSDHTPECGSHTPEEDCTCGECFLDCSCGFDEQQQTQSTGRTRVGEWVSPPLRSYHSRGLKHLGDALENRRTNTTPGVHVHVDAGDLSPEQIAQVGLIYTALEPLFEAEYHREVRNYCKAIPVEELVGRFKESRRIKSATGQTIRNFQASDRYFTVNVASLQRHGTIEFRAMGPRYNYEFLTRWAHFLREILNLAKANTPQKEWSTVKSFRELVVLFSKYGKETPTPEWAEPVKSADVIAELLGTENRRVGNRMAKVGGGHTVFDDYTAVTARMDGDAQVRADVF